MAEENFSRSIIKDLELEFEKQENCDAVFEADGQTIGAHKFMLRVRNKALSDMVASWTLGDKPILIEDMDYDSFKALLRFVYTDEISLSNENVFRFLYASTHFSMHQLEERCAGYISNSLTAENMCIYMNEAINFNSTVLQARCTELFSECTSAVLANTFFMDISQPALSALLEAENTDVLEIELFLEIEGWMRERCHDNELPVDGTNMRHVIGDALYKIRFPTMTAQDFANSVTTIKGLLTDTEMAQVFQMITVFDTTNIDCPFSNKFRCQKNNYYTPFNDIAQLLKKRIIYNNDTERYCDVKSMLKYVEDISNEEQITVTSLRIILQCCADLANSTDRTDEATSDNHIIRTEIKDDFCAWQDVISTENNHNIMTNYLHLRSKLDKICGWD